MKKKMYNQPATEVASVCTSYLMQAPVISGGGKSSDDPEIIDAD